jgi:molecular chaperone DnaK
MIDAAETHRANDLVRRELAEAKNQLDGLIYNSARSFEEFGSNLSNADAIALRDALEQARGSLDSTEIAKVQAGHDGLFQAAQRLADAIYGSLGDQLAEGEFDDDDFDDDDFDDDVDDDDLNDDDVAPAVEIDDDDAHPDDA